MSKLLFLSLLIASEAFGYQDINPSIKFSGTDKNKIQSLDTPCKEGDPCCSESEKHCCEKDNKDPCCIPMDDPKCCGPTGCAVNLQEFKVE